MATSTIMKSLNEIVLEKLKISKAKIKYTLFPESKKELIEMINKEIKANGKNCSLNHIDTSEITDMSYLFGGIEFDGDISNWDVSNVTTMERMFFGCLTFSGQNSNISKWDTSSVKDMSYMFIYTKFDGDISGWDVSNVVNMSGMFLGSSFTGQNTDFSKWNLKSLWDASIMFEKTPFNGDISMLDTSNVRNMRYMFDRCEFDGDLSKWDVSNVKDMTHMFCESKYTGKNGDISNWKVNKVDFMREMFAESQISIDLSKWKLKDNCDTARMFFKSPLARKKKMWPQQS